MRPVPTGAAVSGPRALTSVAVVAAALVGCGGGTPVAEPPRDAPAARLSAVAALGERLFHDVSLSASGRLSCAGCHAAGRAHAQDDGLPAPRGGPALDRQGTRQSPSLRYAAFAPPFRLDSAGRPLGGLFWDGRADTLAEQAGRPFLDPREMALPDRAALAARLAASQHADEFRRLFGAAVLDNPDEAFDRATEALARYQQEDPDFAPFSSRFDAVRAGRATFSDSQARGLALFIDPAKGNCAACHSATPEPDGTPPLFTNFGYAVLGVPRQTLLQANADPAFFDLGLCARAGGDLAARTDLCGAFRTPSLRNVARRQALFHNGRFTSLREAVAFYVLRDITPGRFYPLRADGSVGRFDDLPPALHGNIERARAPYDRGPGATPALSEDEIDDVVAFLHTLSDEDPP